MKNFSWVWPESLGRWLAGGLIWRTLVAIGLPAGFDEVYYYIYSRNLDWSYFDHPVMVALTTGAGWWITRAIAPLTIRLGALLLYTLSLLLLFCLGKHLYSERAGILAVAIASIAPILWISFGTLASPDASLMVFWTLTVLLAAWEFFPPASHSPGLLMSAYQPSYRIALIGLTLGLACLSKYHGFILGVGLVGFCLTSDRTRKALWSPWMGVALLICCLTLIPLWYWNSQHDWYSFRFHLGMRFAGEGQPNPYRIGDALGTWLLGMVYLCPTIGVPLWWVTGRSLSRVLSLPGKQNPAGWYTSLDRERTALLLWVSLPIAVGFTLLGGKQAIYPAWPAPGFWGLTLLLAKAASEWRSRLLGRWLGGTALFLATLVLIALLHLSFGILQKPSQYALLGGMVPVAQDGSTTLLPVGQLRSRFTQSPELMAALAGADFVLTDEFYLSGYVDMALYPLTAATDMPKPTTTFSQDPRGFAFWFPSTTWLDRDALYLTLASLHPDRAALVAEFQPYFRAIEPVGEVPLTRGGAVTDTVLVYRAIALHTPYPYPYP
jgi:4-amino-4-deoxy-L-arabinose transferase-like glycosyltransferase